MNVSTLKRRRDLREMVGKTLHSTMSWKRTRLVDHNEWLHVQIYCDTNQLREKVKMFQAGQNTPTSFVKIGCIKISQMTTRKPHYRSHKLSSFQQLSFIEYIFINLLLTSPSPFVSFFQIILLIAVIRIREQNMNQTIGVPHGSVEYMKPKTELVHGGDYFFLIFK